LESTTKLPATAAVLRMADTADQAARFGDPASVQVHRLLVFNDSTVDCGLVRHPTRGDARAILAFYREALAHDVPLFIAQCQEGVGRSVAVIAALLRERGRPEDMQLEKELRKLGTHNRLLHRLLLEELGQPIAFEPLVSIVARIKYGRECVEGLILSMQRQRWKNWELVLVSDGPMMYELTTKDPRVRLVVTPESRGCWGHPYRQLGIDAARGDWIGLTNDDNYYVPGYLEQMMLAVEDGAELVLCQMLHSNAGWLPIAAGSDLGCFLAKAELVRRVPFDGTEYQYDRVYIQKLVDLSASTAVVDRPLFIHN
jgi:predicted protein tyrosine phosphatase